MYIVGKYYQGNPDQKPDQWGSIADVQYAVRANCEDWIGVDYDKVAFAVPGWSGSGGKIIDLGYKSSGFGSVLRNGNFDNNYGINLTNTSYAYLNSTLRNNNGEEFSLFFDFMKKGSSTSRAILAGYDNNITYGYVAAYPGIRARIRFNTSVDFTSIRVFSKRNQLVFVCDKNKNAKAYQNALLKQTISVPNTEFDFNQIGALSAPYSIDDATIYNSFGFKTALNTQQVELLSNQPSKLFQPVLRPLYFDFTDLPETSVFSLDMSWEIKNESSKNISSKILNEKNKSLDWKTLNEQSKDMSWLIFNQVEKSSAWKVLNLSQKTLDYKVLDETSKDISFKIKNESSSDIGYKILTESQKRIAWRILTSGVLSLDISWEILNESEKEISSKIFNESTKDISWKILGISETSVNLAWKILNEVEQIVEWKIQKEKESGFAWKILNELSLDTSFNILEIKSADLAYKIFNTIEKDTSWKIVSGVETKTIDFTSTKRILDFNSEQKIYAFNSKTRTLIFYQKERK